ncbi:PKD domain-containing protein [Halorientalis halophila]|uniref:PKD domain-containing protein n=1 Tax=Halorientalis halophila TaxID=3108499 RepID=UPI003008F49E
MTASTRKLRALTLAVVIVCSVVTSGVALTGTAGAAAGNTAGSVAVSAATAGNQATVTVDDGDLNTNAGVTETHVVNIESTRESPTRRQQTSSDTPDGGTQTITITDSVYDANNDGTITASDFSLSGGFPDESITNVARNGGDYDVTISDAGSTYTDSSTEYVGYDALTSLETGSDTEQGSPTTLRTTGPVGDRNGDGEITAADVDLVTKSDDESITNVVRNPDGTADVEITDSNSDGDKGTEKIEYLTTETVKLTETGPDTGTFDGTITIKTGGLVGNDELYVTHQDDITVHYWDSSVSTMRSAAQTYKLVAAAASATPTAPATGESVSLSGSASEGSISSYAWDTDDDNTYDDASGSSPSVSFSSEGVHPVGLRVSDGTHTDTSTVNVLVGESGPPTAKLDVFPRYVTRGEAAYLVAQESSDDIPSGIERYEWDVGADGSYEYSSTSQSITQHTFSSTGDHDVRARVTDYAGNTDTVTKTVTVQEPASISRTSVEHTGNGTAPGGTVELATRNEGGMLKIHLYHGASKGNRDLSSIGVDESTELWVNVTMSNYEPNAMMASAKVDEWVTEDAGGGKTKLAIKMHAINMQRLSSISARSPGRWPSTNKQADMAIAPGAHLATFDMPDGSQFESDFDGATLSSDAQLFSPPRYDAATNKLTYSVAAPHWNASGSKVASNTNSGFYEATIPSGLVSRMGIQNPGELAAKYTSGGSTSSLSDMVVRTTDGGGLYIKTTGIHYSSGTVELEPDSTAPTADAGADKSVTAGSSFSFDGTASSDNRVVDSYEWDTDGDGTYELTGSKPSHSYSGSGSKTVTLRVTDGNGNTDTDTLSVDVSGSTTGGGGAGYDAPVDVTTTDTATATPDSTTSTPDQTTDTPDQTTEPATATPRPAETEDPKSTDTPTTTPTDSDGPASATAPGTAADGSGFGAGIAVLALLAVLLLARRRDER